MASLASLLALAVALSMDATAVAAARGVAAPTVRLRDALTLGLLFGGAQAVMPLIGALLGDWLGPAVAAFDHWIAFALLVLIGGKMIREARADHAGDEVPRDPFAIRKLLVLAVATSIDALAAGITLPLLGFSPYVSAATIGVITAAFSFAGVYAGRRLGARLGPRLEWVGGITLILLGVKVLVEHLLDG